MTKIIFICEKLQKQWTADVTFLPRIGESVKVKEYGHLYKYMVTDVETVICGDISLPPDNKIVKNVVYVKPVRHGADTAGVSKKEKKERTKMDIAAAATA